MPTHFNANSLCFAGFLIPNHNHVRWRGVHVSKPYEWLARVYEHGTISKIATTKWIQIFLERAALKRIKTTTNRQ